MISFELTEEQKLLKDTVRKYLEKKCPREYLRDLDEKEEYPHELFKGMATLGWLGLTFPEKYGGSGGNAIDAAILLEELGRAVQGCAFGYVSSVCFGGRSIDLFGNERQKSFYLPKLINGEIMFAMALTEPGGGTDILNMKTYADIKEDGFIINGQKTFITNAHVADHLITIVRTDRDVKKKSGGISVFIVDTNSAGIEMKRLRKLGIKSTGTNEIFFTDVHVPSSNLLGELNRGWHLLTGTLNDERVSVAAILVGIAQAAFEDALKYAKERVAFNKVIGQFQVIQHYIADMAVSIELARMIVLKAAWLQSKGLSNGLESAMAKLVASETAFKVATTGMRILGGYGYMMEYDMQRYFRDSELFLFAPISNEMSKNYIGQNLGLPRSF